jgi:hypothetical protein
MSIRIQRNELPPGPAEAVAKGILSAIGDGEAGGSWNVDITSEDRAYAWDVEVVGPNHFYWARRFSGEDRDAQVISAAVRSAVLDRAA